MGTKSTSGGTQTTIAEPPAYLKPYLTQAANAATQQFQQGGPQQYGGSTVAPFSQVTQDALSGMAQRGAQGSPLIGQAQGFVQQGLNAPISSQFGNAQNPYAAAVDAGSAQNPYAMQANQFGGATNPYLDATYSRALENAMQGVESQFARGGRNIGASLPVAGDIASQLASQIYAPAYENERNRQLQMQSQLTGIGAQSFENQQARQLQSGLAAQGIGAQGYEQAQNRALSDLTSQRGLQQNLLGYASPLAAQDYMDLASRLQAGQAYDMQNQAMLNDEVNRFNYQQNLPGMNLDAYIQRLTGMPGSTSTTQLPTQYRNQTAGALGGALAGGQLGSVFGPWGTGIGAVLGGLGGLL